MNVIGHDDPRVKPIALVAEEQECACNQISDVGTLKPALTHTFVEISFQFAEVISFQSVQNLRIRWRGAEAVRGLLLGMKSPDAVRPLGLVFHQNILRQRIRETKRNEVTNAFPF